MWKKAGAALGGEHVKAILADDEKKICMLLRELIDWEALGIEIIAEAYTGNSAYEKIRQLKPDIVVTDIRMPGMDGLEMIRRLKREGLETEFVIISGHKSFEYAHSAIQYGVSNYLLKPLTATELYENLVEVCRRILTRKNKLQELERLRDKLDYSYQLIGKQFVSRFCNEPDIVNGKNIREINREYLTDFTEGVFAVGRLHICANRNMSREQNVIMLDKVEIYFKRRLKGSQVHAASGQHEGDIVLLLNGKDRTEIEICLKEILADAQAYFSDFCTMVLGLSSFGRHFAGRQLYEAELALSNRLDLGTNRVISYGEGSVSVSGVFPHPSALQQLLDIVQLVDLERFQAWLQENSRGLTAKETPPVVMLKGAHTLVETLKGAFTSYYGEEIEEKEIREIHAAISGARDRVEIVQVLGEWIKVRMERQSSQLQEQGAHFIRDAQRYISQHYAEAISLQDVADHVHMNPTYFSTLFKKKQGVGFNEYLVHYRLEIAKRLLADPSLSIASVGSRVGYGDAAYFSKLFTKMVGIRPKDFRKLCL